MSFIWIYFRNWIANLNFRFCDWHRFRFYSFGGWTRSGTREFDLFFDIYVFGEIINLLINIYIKTLYEYLLTVYYIFFKIS